jgi:(E)-4-hydroxy-3-methylbut-2-enyl-diphosphate synthase
MKIERRPTRAVWVGKLKLGGTAPIRVQSMLKTDSRDVISTLRQIRGLERAGCELVRLAIPDQAAVEVLRALKSRVKIPLVADIHFDYRLGVEAARAGADKLRINPGNIGAKWKLSEVIRAAKDRGIPVRIGINTGSLERSVLERYHHPTAEAILESLSRTLEVFEKHDFNDLVISAKASDLHTTVDAYRAISERFDYPLHLGLTEAGLPLEGSVRSATTLGILLSQGIGDTIRVSLAGNPRLEVEVAYELLRSLGLRECGPTLLVCPSCGRCEIDLLGLARKVNRALKGIREPIRVAVMGCMVNGPGEAREADYGVAGGRGVGLIFKEGKVIRKVPEAELTSALLELIATDQGDSSKARSGEV